MYLYVIVGACLQGFFFSISAFGEYSSSLSTLWPCNGDQRGIECVCVYAEEG